MDFIVDKYILHKYGLHGHFQNTQTVLNEVTVGITADLYKDQNIFLH